MDQSESEFGPQDVATMLVALGRDRAMRLLSHFDPDEIELLSSTSKSLGRVSQSLMERLTADFERHFERGAGLLRADRTFGAILEETRRSERGDEEVEADQPEDSMVGDWDRVAAADEDAIAALLATEGSLVRATILGRIHPPLAGRLVARMPEAERLETLEAMLEVAPTDAAERVVLRHLKEALGLDEESSGKSAGPDKLSNLLNALGPDDAVPIGRQLRSHLPAKVAREVFAFVFRFEDIARLEAADCSRLCDEVSKEILTRALVEAPQDLAEVLLSSVGGRTRRMMEGEIALQAALPPADIEAARRELVTQIITLARQGDITLPSDDDE